MNNAKLCFPVKRSEESVSLVSSESASLNVNESVSAPIPQEDKESNSADTFSKKDAADAGRRADVDLMDIDVNEVIKNLPEDTVEWGEPNDTRRRRFCENEPRQNLDEIIFEGTTAQFQNRNRRLRREHFYVKRCHLHPAVVTVFRIKRKFILFIVLDVHIT
jgi:hypothetical protein